MDANQQRFWMLADPADWPQASSRSALAYDPNRRRLRLRARLPDAPQGRADEAELTKLLRQPAWAADAFGTMAFWDQGRHAIGATGAVEQSTLAPAPLGGPIADAEALDLAMGFDGVLYVAFQGLTGGGSKTNVVRLLDRRDRWKLPEAGAKLGEFRGDLCLDPYNFQPHRLAADPAGGVWVLDREAKRLGRIRGHPLPDHLPGLFADTVFRPEEENPDPPRFEIDPRFPSLGDEEPVAIACSPEGRLALLTWWDGDTLLRLREPDGRWQSGDLLLNAGKPASVAWLSPKCLAVIPAPRFEPPDPSQPRKPREAVAYDLEQDHEERRDKPVPSGGFLPLTDLDHGLFAQGVTLPPYYPVKGGKLAPLLGLSAAALQPEGTTIARVLDSGVDGTVWHRLYLEAAIPPHCGISVKLAATDDPEPDTAKLAWFPHRFGEAPEDKLGAAMPCGVWQPDRSELPHHAGLLGCEPKRDRCGLFTVLVQRAGRRVRALSGRYLHVTVSLFGTGHATPEIAALRVYGPRFSYRDSYLPELYREELFGLDADADGPATPPDFLERFLDLFESVLTPLEDRVASAHVLMDPRSTPEEALEWLGSWLGVLFEPAFPVACRRAWIAAAHRLYRTRGTLAGLQLALEIATGGRLVREFVAAAGREVEFPRGGGVTGGRVLVIEDFRLRRTMATILGANLSAPDDPLLPGLLCSANSTVGDTLMLGEEEKAEFIALFRHAFSDLPAERAKEADAVFALCDKLAHRATILVHQEVTLTDLGLLRRIAAQEAPAHLEVRVEPATYPLLVGLASLVDVDTYLTPHLPRGAARLNECRLGENAFIQQIPALDPRLTR